MKGSRPYSSISRHRLLSTAAVLPTLPGLLFSTAARDRPLAAFCLRGTTGRQSKRLTVQNRIPISNSPRVYVLVVPPGLKASLGVVLFAQTWENSAHAKRIFY